MWLGPYCWGPPRGVMPTRQSLGTGAREGGVSGCRMTGDLDLCCSPDANAAAQSEEILADGSSSLQMQMQLYASELVNHYEWFLQK